MSLLPNKYKFLTNQIYHFLKDEILGKDFAPFRVFQEIQKDEFLKILVQKQHEREKISLSFMVSLFSKTSNLEFSMNEVRNNLIKLDLTIFRNLDYRLERCGDCVGNGKVECSECSGRGDVSCHSCDGDGKNPCDQCSESGLVEGELCDVCYGRGQVDCKYCDGRGEVECPVCDGDGKLICKTCEGEGTYYSDEKYYTEEIMEFYCLNRRLLSIPIGQFLTNEQNNSIFFSKPFIEESFIKDRWVKQSEPRERFKGVPQNENYLIVVNTKEPL